MKSQAGFTLLGESQAVAGEHFLFLGVYYMSVHVLWSCPTDEEICNVVGTYGDAVKIY